MPSKIKSGKGSSSANSDVSNKKSGMDSERDGSLPSWPPLKPLVPESDLSLHVLVPDQIITVPKLFSAKLCKDYVNFLRTLPLTTTPGKPKKGEAVRVNDRFQVEDARFADMLWSGTALKGLVEGTNSEEPSQISTDESRKLFGEVLTLNPNIRVYRYSQGQFFDQHYDDSNQIILPGGVTARTTWTLLIYLTSAATGCIGGETVFYPEADSTKKSKGTKGKALDPVVVELDVGMGLLHRHGAECMLHEGREVLKGEKWVIRSDLCVKR